MGKERPGTGPLEGLVCLSLLTLGTEVLPGTLAAAGSAAWLCPLLAGAGAGAVLLPVWKGTEPRSAGGMGRRLLSVLLLLWGLQAAATETARVGQRLAADLRGSPLLLGAAALLLAAWMASGGLAALERAGQIFTLAVGVTFGMILLFALPGVRWDWVILWRGTELKGVPGGALEVLAQVSVLAYPLLLCRDREQRRGGRRLAGTVLLLAAAELLVIGRLGPGLTGQVDTPFFQMVSGLGFQGAFQRLEELVSALWLLGDLTLLALLLLSLRELLTGATGRKGRGGQVWLPAGGALLLLFCRPVWSGWTEGIGWGLAGLGAAGGVLLLSRRKKSKK